MDDPEDTSRDNVLWGDAMEEIFIDMLYQDALQGRLKGRKITFREHGAYAQRLTAVGKKVFDGNQVRGKLTRLKGMQRLFTDLLSQTGMGWDPDTKTVVPSDECWENAIRIKAKWGRFRTFGCPKYEELCTIFGASVAYGTMQHASTQLPVDSDEERHLDEEMRARRPPVLGHRQGLPIDNDDFIDLMGIGSPSVDAVTQSSRRPKTRKKSDFEVQLSEAVEEVKLTQRARRKRYEDQEAVESSKRSKESQPSDGTNGGYDPINYCATLLSELFPRLEPSQLVRAIKELLNPDMRQFFLSLDATGRDDWARNC
ncbi:uncharacterized protein LOC121235511 [Juglans microcarpa x Juglans regia]|uniref:uncharacterized protein LOC121235511 n=1 Tax=Juglans microcarpa x Juglans regia TaxID=2249226 RepID=UPI001B7E9E09|nr:uncharacterized protein LOC121235511 [Juglans microcarpa x Juglans regia]